MKKLIITLLASTLLFVTVAMPVFAAEYVNSETQLTQSEAANLINSATGIKQKFGTDVFIIHTKSEGSAKDLAESFVSANGISNSYIVFSVTSEYYYCVWSDDLNLPSDISDYIFDSITDYEENEYEFCSNFYSTVASVLENRTLKPYKYVRDQAGVLSDDEEKALNEKLTDLSEKLKFDIVALTANGVSTYERMEYADDYYDNNGYGYGEDKDGVLLLVNIGADGYSTGNSWVSTCGKGIDYISDDDIQDIGQELTPMLLSGDYSGAFDTFANLVEREISFEKFFGVLVVIAVTIILCIIIAFIYTGKLKRELRSVAAAADANNYMIKDSLNIKRSYDHYLYSHVTKTEKPSSKSGSSGSHSSSSGTSHGGGGF